MFSYSQIINKFYISKCKLVQHSIFRVDSEKSWPTVDFSENKQKINLDMATTNSNCQSFRRSFTRLTTNWNKNSANKSTLRKIALSEVKGDAYLNWRRRYTSFSVYPFTKLSYQKFNKHSPSCTSHTNGLFLNKSEVYITLVPLNTKALVLVHINVSLLPIMDKNVNY